MNIFLLRVIRTVIRADSDPVRQALFANLRQSRLPARMVFGLHELLGTTPASGLLVSGYGLAFFVSIAVPRNRRARILSVARHANARRQIRRIVAWLGPEACDAVDTKPSAVLREAGLLPFVMVSRRRAFLKALRIVRAADRRVAIDAVVSGCGGGGPHRRFMRGQGARSVDRGKSSRTRSGLR